MIAAVQLSLGALQVLFLLSGNPLYSIAPEAPHPGEPTPSCGRALAAVAEEQANHRCGALPPFGFYPCGYGIYHIRLEPAVFPNQTTIKSYYCVTSERKSKVSGLRNEDDFLTHAGERLIHSGLKSGCI